MNKIRKMCVPNIFLIILHTSIACCKQIEAEEDQDLDVSDSAKPIYRRYYALPAMVTHEDGLNLFREYEQPELDKVQQQQYQQEHQPPAGYIPSATYDQHAVQAILGANPLLAALFLSHTLGIKPSAHPAGYNHPQHLPVNPYVALLLSHYGRYLSVPSRTSRGIYGYVAANSYHNNMPFGTYKINEDAKK